jgi:release factor glutamine methyltransferase
MSLPAHEIRRLRAATDTDDELNALIERRLGGEPLQYLEGSAAFGPWDLHVDHRVLIPRPETELLWEIASAAVVGSPRVIVDLCTGSGALAIALAKTFPEARVLGTDLSVEALDVARVNGISLEAAVEWCRGDLFAALPEHLAGAVDLLVSNPPYVAEHEYAELPEDVRWEPKLALVSGPTGLEAYERIAAEIGRWLAPGGRFALEVGETQADAVVRLFTGFSPAVRQDLNRRDRFVIGARS